MIINIESITTSHVRVCGYDPYYHLFCSFLFTIEDLPPYLIRETIEDCNARIFTCNHLTYTKQSDLISDEILLLLTVLKLMFACLEKIYLISPEKWVIGVVFEVNKDQARLLAFFRSLFLQKKIKNKSKDKRLFYMPTDLRAYDHFIEVASAYDSAWNNL